MRTSSLVRKTSAKRPGSSQKHLGLPEIGGILTQPLLSSYHVFNNMHQNRMNIGDFYDLACFNSLSYFNCLGPISRSNRHQRHQTKKPGP